MCQTIDDNKIIQTKDIIQYQGRPLRILQVHTLYPTYVPYYYKIFPNASSQSFSKQVEMIYKHGLQDMYIVAPLLKKMGCEAQLVYSNANAAQRAWCTENGFPVDVLTNPDWEKIILAAQIEAFKPDVVFFSDNHNFDGHFLESLSFQPALVVAWRHASIDVSTYWNGFDVLLSPSRRTRNLALHLGVKKAIHYMFGLPTPAVFPTDDKLKQRDLFFCGTYKTPFAPNCHSERRKLLHISAAICKHHKAQCDLFLSDTPESLPKQLNHLVRAPLYGKRMYEEIIKSRIGIDALGSANGTIDGLPLFRLTMGDVVNMRLFEHVNFGALAFTENRGRLNKFFEPNKEVVTYSSRAEFSKKLSHYISHKDEARAIATAGYERIRKQFDQRKTLFQLLKIFQQELKVKEYSQYQKPQVPTISKQLIHKMLNLLEQCPYSEDSSGWEIEENLFNIVCHLAVNGDYATARELDTLINKTPFVLEDLGYLANSLKLYNLLA